MTEQTQQLIELGNTLQGLISSEMWRIHHCEGGAISLSDARHIAIETVADAAGLSVDEVKRIVCESLKLQTKAKQVKPSKDGQKVCVNIPAHNDRGRPGYIPVGRLSKSNPFDMKHENRVDGVADELKKLNVSVGQAVEFPCTSYENAREIQHALPRAIARAGWERYRSIIKSDTLILYVLRLG